MPGGGFVMSFTDITASPRGRTGPQGANESLEQRVQERTQELSQLNQELSEEEQRRGRQPVEDPLPRRRQPRP